MSLAFHLNGAPVRVEGAPPTTTLLDWLRDVRRLTGTKEGCAEGDCGACTVLVRRPGEAVPRAIDACLVLVPMVQGCFVWTVEGLGTALDPHPVQRAIETQLASQCGFCTPGIAMSLAELCHREAPTAAQIDDQLCGNLCRCTGYRPIRDVARALAGTRPADGLVAGPAEPPPAPAGDGYLEGAGRLWYAPADWDELWDVLEYHPDYRLIAGGTDLGLDINLHGLRPPVLVSVERLPGIAALAASAESLRIGAGAPLADVEAWSSVELPVLARMLRFFGSRQIKHRATVGGNLATASPIGDLAPVLLALDAVVVVRGRGGERAVPIDAFFPAYRRTAVAPGEVIAAVHVPRPGAAVRLAAYKVSRRREMDISAVSAAFAVHVEEGRVARARIAFGGLAATPKRAIALEAALVGAPWTRAAVDAALDSLDADFTPIDDHRASAWYRRAVARNLVVGFLAETERQPFRPLAERPLSTFAPDSAPLEGRP